VGAEVTRRHYAITVDGASVDVLTNGQQPSKADIEALSEVVRALKRRSESVWPKTVSEWLEQQSATHKGTDDLTTGWRRALSAAADWLRNMGDAPMPGTAKPAGWIAARAVATADLRGRYDYGFIAGSKCPGAGWAPLYLNPVATEPSDLLKRARDHLVELGEAVHSMRGNPSVPWQQDWPEYAATVAAIDSELASRIEPPQSGQTVS
jgi:hypothetical protein